MCPAPWPLPEGVHYDGNMLLPVFQKGILLLAPLVNLDQVHTARGTDRPAAAHRRGKRRPLPRHLPRRVVLLKTSEVRKTSEVWSVPAACSQAPAECGAGMTEGRPSRKGELLNSCESPRHSPPAQQRIIRARGLQERAGHRVLTGHGPPGGR